MISPERVKSLVQEYTTLVTNPKNNINLLGHQPSLQNIRKAFKSKQIDSSQLTLVLTALANKHQGQEESFKSVKHFAHYAWPKRPKAKKPTLAPQEEQVTSIQAILDLKPKRTKAPKATPKPTFNIDHLPDDLKYLGVCSEA